MAWDWMTEHFGGSLAAEITDTYQLPLPSGIQGATRLVELNPSAGPQIVLLPFGGYSRPGEHLVVWNSNSTHHVSVLDQGLSVVANILPGEVAKFFLRDNSIGSGSWAVSIQNGAAGQSLTFDRVPIEHTVTSDTTDFNLRSYLNKHGYDGSKPAALRVTLGTPSYQYVMGASTVDGYGFDTGEWPAGTTLLLVNHALVSGRGGDGGPGGPKNQLVLLDSLNGGPAGDGMALRVDTWLVNYRTIQGGGGGGAGSAGDSLRAGGGGGGGAGHGPSVGGPAGSGGGATQGMSGGAYGPGHGGNGAMSGAYGGVAGGTGSGANSSATFIGGIGGAAGRSIVRASGVTVTKIRTGTVTGSEAVL